MSSPKKPQAILFDLDGVVNNSKYFSEIYAERYNVPLQNIQKVFNDGRKDLTNIGKADLKDIMKDVLDDWQWSGTVEELLNLWFKTDLYIDKKVIQTIQRLRSAGIKCYLATDQEKYSTEYFRTKTRLMDHFDNLFVSCEIGYDKHQKEFFEFIIKSLTLPANDILYIDDSQSKLDVAQKTGVRGYYYTSFDEFEAFVESFDDTDAHTQPFTE